MTKYTYQPADGAPIESFSDSPSKAHGVKYHPKWSWSASYRKWFTKSHRKAPATMDDDARTRAYRDWYLETKGAQSPC